MIENHKQFKNNVAYSGNRTLAARMAGEHSTTEPTMLDEECLISINIFYLKIQTLE